MYFPFSLKYSKLVSVTFLLTIPIVNASNIIEHSYDDKITYNTGMFTYNDKPFSTSPQHPQEQWTQSTLMYRSRPQELDEECILKKVIKGQDGRERISQTTQWPYSIHAQLTMVFNGQEYGGSGSMVGPHHLLTCGHNVYSIKTNNWAESIVIYPALNKKSAPFGKLKATKVYTFKEWVEDGNKEFDHTTRQFFKI